MPRSANQKLADAAVGHALLLARHSDALATLIHNAYRDEILPAVEERLARALTRGPNSWTSARLQAVREVARGEFAAATADSRRRVAADAAVVARGDALWQAAQAGRALGLNLATPPDAKLAELARNPQIRSATMSSWFAKIGSDAGSRVEALVRSQMQSGATPADVAKTLLSQEGALFLAASRAVRDSQAVARTMVAEVSSRSREETYRANSDVIKGVQIVATLDSRTTEICQNQDGKVYDVGEGLRPPFHWNCRTTTVPVTKSFAELGVTRAREVPEGMRASIDGQVAASQTYEQWLRARTPAQQDAALGRAQGELFRQGGPARVDPAPVAAAPEETVRAMAEVPSVTGQRPVNEVTFHGSTRREDVEAGIADIGLDATPEEIAAALLPDDGTVYTERRISGAVNEVKVEAFGRNEKGSRSTHTVRFIGRDEGGKLYVRNEHFYLDVDKQGAGRGTQMFAAQVERSRALGVTRFETIAARRDSEFKEYSMNGYYTWPRLGYDAPLRKATLAKLPPELRAVVKNVSDLVATPEGRAWWRENGDETYMTFDLDPGSLSSRVLAAYLKEKSRG